MHVVGALCTLLISPVADAQRAGFTDLDLVASGFGRELWGHDGPALAIMRGNKETWKHLKWGSDAAGAVERWAGVKQASGGFVLELSLSMQDLEGMWQTGMAC